VEDGRDTPSDYRPSKPRRVQALDGVPRTGIRNKKMSTYVAPTAPMIPGPSSMGQTESKLNAANLALNRATPSKYQKHYRTSMDDRMARGSRNKPASNSRSVSDILFDINQDSPARRSPEIPLWQQDQSIGAEARSASKRVCSVDNEAGTGRKRKKHTDEVLCPRRSLVVKLKLTREKIPQGAHRQHYVAEPNASIPLGPLVSPVDRLQSYTSLPPTQECHSSPPSLQAHRRETMAPPSSRDSRSRQHMQPSVANQPEESILYEDTVMSPLTPSSTTSRPTAAAYVNTCMEVSGDKDHQEQSQLTAQDLATQQSQFTLAAQEAVSRATEALRTVSLERTGLDAQMSMTEHHSLPAAASAPVSDNGSEGTVVPTVAVPSVIVPADTTMTGTDAPTAPRPGPAPEVLIPLVEPALTSLEPRPVSPAVDNAPAASHAVEHVRHVAHVCHRCHGFNYFSQDDLVRLNGETVSICHPPLWRNLLIIFLSSVTRVMGVNRREHSMTLWVLELCTDLRVLQMTLRSQVLQMYTTLRFRILQMCTTLRLRALKICRQ
jgi:hypothetical protein